jgi:16S rRNA (guanine527-N7)-methyltransferase
MLTAEHIVLLTQGAEQLNVTVTEDQISQITTYLEELQRWAKIVDLVSQSDPTTIIRKHILDSLAVLPLLPANGRILDLGSGAGFPGLPIAITKPHLFVNLLEPRRKRVNFLKEVIRKTSLTNARAYEGRAEEFVTREGWQSAFNIVISRATWNLREFLLHALPFLGEDGFIIAMKGQKGKEELMEAKGNLIEFNLTPQTQYHYVLPREGEKRSILILKKNVSRDTLR